jgi:hypothetical protein
MLQTFDPSKVRFEKIKIKRVTTALGGSVSVLDEKHFNETGKEKFIKINIPLSLARMFKVKYKVTQFMVPHEGVLMYYDNYVITLEKSAENNRFVEGIEGTKIEWTPQTVSHYRSIESRFLTNDWYFDGLYVYRFQGGIQYALDNSTMLDKEGLFRGVKVQGYHLTYLNFKEPVIEDRSCVAIVLDKDNYSISAPIWKTLDTKAKMTNDDDSDDEKTSLISSFDGVDRHVAVNINFALKAAKELSDQFGYDSIQPLQLPKLMVQLKTVNLPRLPKEVKSTTDIGLKFTHGLAWLLGLQLRTTDLDQFVVIRQLTKYLLTKGFYWKDKTNKKTLVHVEAEELPLFKISEDMLSQPA